MASRLPDYAGIIAVEREQDCEKLRCAFRKTDKPRDGKFLKCLHLACGRCVKHGKDDSSRIKCVLCKSSSPCDQLADCQPILYNSVTSISDDESLAPQRKRRMPDRIMCYACNVSDENTDATHRCTVAHCLQPSCDDHAIRHPSTGFARGHVVTKLSENTEQFVEQVDRTTRYFAHPGEAITLYCAPCNVPICATCVNAEAHNGHGIHSLKSAANQPRADLSRALEMEETEDVSIRERTCHRC